MPSLSLLLLMLSGQKPIAIGYCSSQLLLLAIGHGCCWLRVLLLLLLLLLPLLLLLSLLLVCLRACLSAWLPA